MKEVKVLKGWVLMVKQRKANTFRPSNVYIEDDGSVEAITGYAYLYPWRKGAQRHADSLNLAWNLSGKNLCYVRKATLTLEDKK